MNNPIHRRHSILSFAFTLILIMTIMPSLRVHAQDGKITFNQPEIVTLTANTTVRLSFVVLQGDTMEIMLSKLAQFEYTAVLIDANNTALPLTQGPDGNVTTSITNAPVGGTYTLVLQATGGAGQVLVQVNSATPVPLASGATTVDITTAPQRFSLDAHDALAVLSLSAPDTLDGPGALPGLALVHAETGDEVLSIQPDLLPAVSVTLPANTTFLLTVQGSELPGQITADWQPIPQTTTPPDPASSSPADTSNSSSSNDTSSSSAEQCVVYFNGPVNVRSGPDTAYEPPLGTAQAGTTLPATGHNGDYSWYQVDFFGQYGWVALYVNATEARGNCAGLQPVNYPAPPQTDGSQYTYTPSPTYTYTPGGPTLTYTPSPTYTYTPGGPSPTPITPTATYTSTPTQQNAVQASPTHTYTPSYTPTTPPPAAVAPPDANFNAPLNIPLDSTVSTTDFVSYPDGDTIDRARFDITGMNQNASLSGGRARLIIAVSCFGTGTQHITFFTGGQTFTCGQTIVDREVTYDSRTGQVTIEAIGGNGTYVQWVLTGTATRLN